MFHGLIRKKEAEMPTSTPLQVQKQRQIENFRTVIANVIEVVKDVDYRIYVPVGETNVTLIVLLPPHFPQDKPVVHITPSVSHPWVNEQQQVVGCPSLRQFSMHSDLGKVITDIIEEFKKRSPVLDDGAPCLRTTELRYSLMPHDPSSLPGSPIEMGPAPSLAASLSFLTMVCGSLNLTDVPPCFPFLKDLSVEELQALNEDETKLAEYVDEIPLLRIVENHVAAMGVKNEELARTNLDQQPEIEKLKREIIDKASNIGDIKRQFEENTVQFMHGVEKFSPTVIQNILRLAAVQAEEESDKCAQEFLNEQVRVDGFLTQFLEKRTLYHLRKAKEEKLSMQLAQMKHDVTRHRACTQTKDTVMNDGESKLSPR